MGAIGNSADNALAGSCNSTMKREVLRNRKVFANSLQCRLEVFRWCIRCKTQRRHFWCGQISPDVFEAQFIALTKAA
ncbi:integrase core domain-containing protein [Corynebacterium diphtheriae]